MNEDIDARIIQLLGRIARSNAANQAEEETASNNMTLGDQRMVMATISPDEGGGDSYFLTLDDRDEMNAISTEISKASPGLVSPGDVDKYLAYLVGVMKNNGWSRRGLKLHTRQLLTDVKTYVGSKGTATFPVWGLMLSSSLSVGDVEFKPKPFTNDVQRQIQSLDHDGNSIHAVALAAAIGADGIILSNARDEVNKALNILRAFAFPIARNRRWQELSIDGDYRKLTSIAVLEYQDYQSLQPSSNKMLSVHSLISTGWYHPFDVAQLLPLMDSQGYSELLRIMQTGSTFGKRLVKAADWLGEATKPDTLESKFLKVAFALDAMVGDEATNIPDRGKGARIAERSAFILSNRYSARKIIFDKMRDIIGKRDKIAHGSKQEITEADIDEAGKYTKALLAELLLRCPRFDTIQALAKWVQKRSLSG